MLLDDRNVKSFNTAEPHTGAMQSLVIVYVAAHNFLYAAGKY